nr:hypothetical protein [uncultured Undibacterium sp.]
MTHIVKEYVSTNGTKYELKEFDSSQLYHPNTVREVKRSNAEYYDVINADKKRAKLEEAQAAKPKVLSEDEKFAIAVANKKRQDEAKAAAELRHQQQLQQHQDYLASFPDVAEVATTNLLTFVTECHVWLSKNYTLIESTLTSTPTGFNMVMFEAPKAKKK